MEIGRKIIKTLIIILEGCVVRLKEFEAYLEDSNISVKRKAHSDIEHSDYNQSDEQMVPKSSDETFYNISLLDQYVKKLGLPVGTNFMKVIQKVELTTEYNIIEVLMKELPNFEIFYSIFESIKDSRFIDFVYSKPSPIRAEETKVVDKRFIVNELTEIGQKYNDALSLYDNSLYLLEAKQKAIMNDITIRLQQSVERIKLSVEEPQKEKLIRALMKELDTRKKIVEMKLKR